MPKVIFSRDQNTKYFVAFVNFIAHIRTTIRYVDGFDSMIEFIHKEYGILLEEFYEKEKNRMTYHATFSSSEDQVEFLIKWC